MSGYKLISIPLTRSFHQNSDSDLTKYFRWFLNCIPERLNELVNAVSTTSEFKMWRPDKEPNSIKMLGAWFYESIKTNAVLNVENESLGEKEHVLSYSLPYREVPQLPITIASLAFDIGIYLGEVFQSNYSGVNWWLCKTVTDGRRHADYGQPVVINFGDMQHANPFRLVSVVATKMASKKVSADALYDVYKMWSKYIP